MSYLGIAICGPHDDRKPQQTVLVRTVEEVMGRRVSAFVFLRPPTVEEFQEIIPRMATFRFSSVPKGMFNAVARDPSVPDMPWILDGIRSMNFDQAREVVAAATARLLEGGA